MRGRPRGLGPIPATFKDRFQRFYFEHRERLNEERRAAYAEKKKRGLCVRCRRKAVKGSIFCAEHREEMRNYKNARTA